MFYKVVIFKNFNKTQRKTTVSESLSFDKVGDFQSAGFFLKKRDPDTDFPT